MRAFAVVGAVHVLAVWWPWRDDEAGTLVTMADVRERGQVDTTPSKSAGSYEIRIRLERGDYMFGTEHPHPGNPSSDTIVQLKDEAVKTFRALYDEEPDEIMVAMTYYAPGERDTFTLPLVVD